MNKTLLKSVREYKKQSFLAPFFVILEVFMEVLIPLEMAKIIDVGIANGNLNYIIQRGIILVAMAMLALFFGVTAGNMAAVAAAGYSKNLRHDIFYKIQQFSFKNIDHFSTSGLVTRMTTDITNVQMAYMMSIRLLARAPIMIVLSWIMTLLINKKIALLFLIIIPLLGGTLIFIAKKAHPHFIKVFDEYDILNNSVQENVNASRVVKAYVREDHEIQKFHGISKYVYTLFTKAEKIVACLLYTSITVKTENYNRISQDFYNKAIDSLDLNLISCVCGHSGCLIRHGSYKRSIQLADRILSLSVVRVYCKICGHTHALLLSSMVPYSQIPLALHVRLIQLLQQNPEQFRLERVERVKGTIVSKEYFFSKRFVTIRSRDIKRELTEEQRKEIAERLKKLS